MGAYQNRCIPVKALRGIVWPRLGHNVQSLAGLFVDSVQLSLLRFRIDSIRIFWIELAAMAVSTQRYDPVLVSNTMNVKCSGWPKLSGVILRSPDQIVERKIVIKSYLIELGYR
jgi:hypothetical protein